MEQAAGSPERLPDSFCPLSLGFFLEPKIALFSCLHHLGVEPEFETNPARSRLKTHPSELPLKLTSLASFLALATAASATLMADAIPYPYPGTIAPTDTFTAAASGDVIAYFHGSTASYNNQLGLFVDGVQIGGWGLDNHSSNFGDVYDFGHVDAGQTLTFALRVLTTGYTLYSDPSMNPDSINHTYATPYTSDDNSNIRIPPGTFVAFEDQLLGHSDLNYNDEDFVFTNVAAQRVADTRNPPPCCCLERPDFGLTAGLMRRFKPKS